MNNVEQGVSGALVSCSMPQSHVGLVREFVETLNPVISRGEPLNEEEALTLIRGLRRDARRIEMARVKDLRANPELQA